MKLERRWTLLQEQALELFILCGLKEFPIWKLGVSEHPIHPTHQPNWRWVIYFTRSRIRTLRAAWPCTVLALFKMFLQCKAFPVGHVPVKESTGEQLGRIGTLVQVTNTNRFLSEINWINTTRNYYFQLIPKCRDSCCATERGLSGPKRSTHHRPSQVGPVARSRKDWFSRNWNTWLGAATTSRTSVHARKKCRTSQEAVITRL